MQRLLMTGCAERYRFQMILLSYFLPVACLEACDQARRVPAVAAHRLDLGIELIDQRRHRQMGTVVLRLVEANAQILAHPVDREAEIELALGSWSCGGSPSARSPQRPWRSPRSPPPCRGRPHAEMDGLRRALHQAGNGDLVAHLGELARARRAEQLAHARIVRRSAARPWHSRPASPPHMTVSTPFSAPACPPETGASMKPKPALLGGPMQVRARSWPRPSCGRRRPRPASSPCEGAVRPGRDLPQIVVIADAGEDEIGILGGLGAASAPPGRRIAPAQRSALSARAIVDRQLDGRRGSSRWPAIGNPMTPRPIQAARNAMPMLHCCVAEPCRRKTWNGDLCNGPRHVTIRKRSRRQTLQEWPCRSPTKTSRRRANARRQCGAHPPAPCPQAVGDHRRPDLRQVRESAGHQFVQGPRRLSTRCPVSDGAERDRGVIAMSAGNHAQAVAYHAHRLGIPAIIVMPETDSLDQDRAHAGARRAGRAVGRDLGRQPGDGRGDGQGEGLSS